MNEWMNIYFMIIFMSKFQMVDNLSLTIWKPNHLKTDLQKIQISNGQISDPHWIWKAIQENQENTNEY